MERLVIREGTEKYIPKYGIEWDVRFFDLESLVRMYGEEEVKKWIERHR